MHLSMPLDASRCLSMPVTVRRWPRTHVESPCKPAYSAARGAADWSGVQEGASCQVQALVLGCLLACSLTRSLRIFSLVIFATRRFRCIRCGACSSRKRALAVYRGKRRLGKKDRGAPLHLIQPFSSRSSGECYENQVAQEQLQTVCGGACTGVHPLRPLAGHCALLSCSESDTLRDPRTLSPWDARVIPTGLR